MKTLDTGTRIDIKNVLFLTDFSRAAAAAIPYAAEVTKRFEAKLFALHVRPPIVNPMTPPATWPAIEQAAKVQAETQRQELLQAFPGIHAEVRIEEGDFWEILNLAIEKNTIDLIVLGTRGRGGMEKFFLGSTAEGILRRAPCPVLTVGPAAHLHLRGSGDFNEILCATDFVPKSTAAATYAICLAEEFQAHLTLLHVIADEKSGELVHAEQLVTAAEHLLRELVGPDAEMWCQPRFLVERGPTAETILQIAKEKRSDLIVLGVRQASGSLVAATHLPIATVHKVVAHATCPVLTVPRAFGK